MSNLLKKLLTALVVASLLMSLAAPALADTLRFGTVKASNSVNLRQNASTSSKKLGSYRGGTWLRVIDTSGSWYKVEAPDGVVGYMRNDYVFISAAAKGTIGVVDLSRGLTLRKSASSSSASLGVYPDGTPCILLSESGDWYHVTVDGKAGYFKAKYVDKKYMTYASDLATVDTGGGSVNLREGPDTGYRSLKSVKNGSIVMVLQEGEGWWKVSSNGTVGYIDNEFLQSGVKIDYAGSDDAGGEDMTEGGYYARVKLSGSSKLYLREGPSTSSASLGMFRGGTQVWVLERGDNWCKVRVDGETGYMATRYLQKVAGSDDDDDGEDMTEGGYYAKIKLSGSSKLYLREGPSTSSASLGMFRGGTQVWVLERGDTWCKVRVDGENGYMATRYLQKVTTDDDDPADEDDDEDMVTANYYAKVRLSGSGRLNLRAKATTESASLGMFDDGTEVYVLARGENWSKVRVDGETGYMATRYLHIITSDPGDGDDDDDDDLPETSLGYAVVRLSGSSSLHLRANSSTGSKSLGTYPNGTMVEVLTRGVSWCKVRVDGETGYMSTRYLSFNGLVGKPTMIVVHPKASYVNLRSTPNMDNSDNVLVRVPHGAQVEVLVYGKGWCQIRYKSYTGYMVTSFLEDN